MTFIDDFSKYTYVCLLKNKSGVSQVYIKYIENQFDGKIKRFRSDRDKEYESPGFDSYTKLLGTIHETTPSYSPSFTRVVEWKNRNLINLTNAVTTLLSARAYPKG